MTDFERKVYEAVKAAAPSAGSKYNDIREQILAVEKFGNDIDEVTNTIWNSLNEENKVSLFVRFIDIETGVAESRIVNKNQ